MQTCSRAQGLKVKGGERSVCYFSCSCINTTDRRNLREDYLTQFSLLQWGRHGNYDRERSCDLVFFNDE